MLLISHELVNYIVLNSIPQVHMQTFIFKRLTRKSNKTAANQGRKRPNEAGDLKNQRGKPQKGHAAEDDSS